MQSSLSLINYCFGNNIIENSLTFFLLENVQINIRLFDIYLGIQGPNMDRIP